MGRPDGVRRRLARSTREGEGGAPVYARDTIPSLDGLRALACVLVLWSHFVYYFALPSGPRSMGRFGVTLFFSLSVS